MKKKVVGKPVMALALLLLAIGASACRSDDDIIITFDGNECVFSGPSEVETGTHMITVKNTTELTGWMRICRADEGKVWQDILDFEFTPDPNPEGDLFWPTWCQEFPTSSVANADANHVLHEYKLLNEGQYFVIWEKNKPEGAWPCAPLTVRKAAAE
jgi:hypothetical protein